MPEVIPEFRTLSYKGTVDEAEFTYDIGQFLYIGAYKSLNSKMVITGKDKEETSESASKQKTMFAFNYLSSGRPEGSISAYDLYDSTHPRIFDYALYYNGMYGIFERFYRDYDLLLRNSLHETKVKLLLSQSQKQNLPSYAKVVIRGVPFLFNKLKFTLGGKTEPVESELYTVTLMEPINEAPTINGQLKAMDAQYKWVGRERVTEVGWDEYNSSGLDKGRTFVTIYPPLPSVEYVGKPYGKQTSYTEQKTQHRTAFRSAKYKYTKTEVWLECVPK